VVVFIQTYYNRERFFNVGGWLGRELGIFWFQLFYNFITLPLNHSGSPQQRVIINNFNWNLNLWLVETTSDDFLGTEECVKWGPIRVTRCVWKDIAQSVAQPIFLSKSIQIIYIGKSCSKICASSVNFKKLPEVNFHYVCEFSPIVSPWLWPVACCPFISRWIKVFWAQQKRDFFLFGFKLS
jgi:hypothetical protein